MQAILLVDSMIRKSKKYMGRPTHSIGPTLQDCSSHNVIIAPFRINLDLLRNPNDAIRIVKEFRSKEGAKLVARYASLFIACMFYYVLFSQVLSKLRRYFISFAIFNSFWMSGGCLSDS